MSLVYSAATEEELVYKEEIEGWVEAHPTLFSAEFIVTQEGEEGWVGRRERMDEGMLVGLVGKEEEEKEKALVYVCGPAGMIDQVEGWAVGKGGLGKEQVRAEKWW